MTNSWLAYAAYDARRAVTRQLLLSANPYEILGRSERLGMRRTRLSGPCLGNVFGSQPDPIPVIRQLPGNHLDPPLRRRLAWAVSGRGGADWPYVVGGVTPTQGAGENPVQGKGPEA
jgi:hypothetical protein